MKHIIYLLFIGSILVLGACQQQEEKPSLPTPMELIEQSIAYHDPNGKRLEAPITFSIQHASAHEVVARSEITMNYKDSTLYQKLNYSKDSAVVERYVDGDSLRGLLNGSEEFEEYDARKHFLTPSGMHYMTNYYNRLLNLPYLLKNAHMQIQDTVIHRPFKGIDCYWIAVKYGSQETAPEQWRYFFDPKTSRLLGGMYYYTRPERDGDYTLFEGELDYQGIKFPKIQHWKHYHNDQFFGGDEILGVSSGK